MKQDKYHSKLTHNGYIYRMKKSNLKQNMLKHNQNKVGVANMMVSQFVAKINDLAKKSDENLTNSQRMQRNTHGQSINKFLHTSLNLKKTLYPTFIKSCRSHSKQKNKTNYEVKTFKFSQNHFNKMQHRLTFIQKLTNTSHRWQSLQLHRQANKCCQSRMKTFKNAKQNPQIQFYKTNNIFVLKKIPSNQSQSIQNLYPQAKSAKIKYNNLSGIKNKSQIYDKQRKNQNKLQKNQSISQSIQIDEYGNIASPKRSQTRIEDDFELYNRRAKQKKREKQQLLIKTQQNKFIQGKYLLQPWKTKMQEQQSTRATPLT